jgi:hypothetical protein
MMSEFTLTEFGQRTSKQAVGMHILAALFGDQVFELCALSFDLCSVR